MPLSWKHRFDSGVVIRNKQRYCSNCIKGSICDKCDKLVNQTKDFSAKLNELKRTLE